jgi:hypothetical protein
MTVLAAACAAPVPLRLVSRPCGCRKRIPHATWADSWISLPRRPTLTTRAPAVAQATHPCPMPLVVSIR